MRAVIGCPVHATGCARVQRPIGLVTLSAHHWLTVRCAQPVIIWVAQWSGGSVSKRMFARTAVGIIVVVGIIGVVWGVCHVLEQ